MIELLPQGDFVMPAKIDTISHQSIMSYSFICIEPWLNLYGKLLIFLCGQIGSSIGWFEALYLACPLNSHKIKNDFLSFCVRGY